MRNLRELWEASAGSDGSTQLTCLPTQLTSFTRARHLQPERRPLRRTTCSSLLRIFNDVINCTTPLIHKLLAQPKPGCTRNKLMTLRGFNQQQRDVRHSWKGTAWFGFRRLMNELREVACTPTTVYNIRFGRNTKEIRFVIGPRKYNV